MESTRPACIPPPVGFHVMKNLCRVEGGGQPHDAHMCATYTHTLVNVHWQMHMLHSKKKQKNIANMRLWKLLEDIL